MSLVRPQSDHLAVLRAYLEFDRTPGNAKFTFARENFLGIKSLQMIGGLKRQLLEVMERGSLYLARTWRIRIVSFNHYE